MSQLRQSLDLLSTHLAYVEKNGDWLHPTVGMTLLPNLLLTPSMVSIDTPFTATLTYDDTDSDFSFLLRRTSCHAHAAGRMKSQRADDKCAMSLNDNHRILTKVKNRWLRSTPHLYGVIEVRQGLLDNLHVNPLQCTQLNSILAHSEWLQVKFCEVLEILMFTPKGRSENLTTSGIVNDVRPVPGSYMQEFLTKGGNASEGEDNDDDHDNGDGEDGVWYADKLSTQRATIGCTVQLTSKGESRMRCPHLLPTPLNQHGPTCGYCGFLTCSGTQHNIDRSKDRNCIRARRQTTRSHTWRIHNTIPHILTWDPVSIAVGILAPWPAVSLQNVHAKKRRTGERCVRSLAVLVGDSCPERRLLWSGAACHISVDAIHYISKVTTSLWLLIVRYCSDLVEKFNYRFEYHSVIVLYHMMYGLYFLRYKKELEDKHVTPARLRMARHCRSRTTVAASRRAPVNDSVEVATGGSSRQYSSIDAQCVKIRRGQKEGKRVTTSSSKIGKKKPPLPTRPVFIKCVQILRPIPYLSGCLPHVQNLHESHFSLSTVGDTHMIFMHCMRRLKKYFLQYYVHDDTPVSNVGANFPRVEKYDLDLFMPVTLDALTLGPHTVIL